VKRSLSILCLVLIGALVLQLAVPDPAHATTGQTCICVTPKKGKTATGKKANGRPSTITVKWGNPPFSGTKAMVMPMAGMTAQQIAQALANQLAAAGLPVCAVTVDPTTGRAVFCIKCRPPNVGGVSTSCNDTGMSEVTYRTVSSASDPFLRGVAGAFAPTIIAQGGDFTVEVITRTADGAEIPIDAKVTTVAGESGASVNSALVNVLNDEGFDAASGSFDFGDGAGTTPAIFVDSGIYNRIIGVGIISGDDGLSDLRGAAQVLTAVAPATADLNRDGVVDGTDFGLLLDMMHQGNMDADFNGDGVLDPSDVEEFVRQTEADFNTPVILLPAPPIDRRP
jgi:hypothetical protein